MKISIDDLTLQAEKLPASIDSELHARIATRIGVKACDVLGYKITKRSLDARKKPSLKLIYSLTAELRDGVAPLREVAPPEPDEPPFEINAVVKPESPVIIGCGPAGLFCAYVLALAGCRPVVLERGCDSAGRKRDIDSFFKTRALNPESNFLFGEGGAGAWSDGKLFTRVHDPAIRFVLETLAKFGAPGEIMYFSHPHIGSDKLPGVISAMCDEIKRLGGEFRWNTLAKSLQIKGGVCRGVRLADGSIVHAPAVVAACGHSARDFILSLIASGVRHSLKGFQLGCRIEHSQRFVNMIRYGCADAPASVGAADYNFVYHPGKGNAPGATTFCMCPGGEIIPSTALEGQLSTNGMSNSKRDGDFANSALITGVDVSRFKTAADAFSFLNKIEKKVFESGGSDYSFPAQKGASFMRGTLDPAIPANSCRLGARPGRLDSILPPVIADIFKKALLRFDSVAPGFIEGGTLVGVETHVSSPVRFERDQAALRSSLEGFYTAGEGAGMAGGITSSAVDGIRIAEAMLKG